MHTRAEKKTENADTPAVKSKQNKVPAFQFMDNRPEAIAQRKLQETANNSGINSNGSVAQLKPVVQRQFLIGEEWKEPYDQTIIDAQKTEVTPFLSQWAQMNTIFDKGTVGKTRTAKENYLNNTLQTDIIAMLRKYNHKKGFANNAELTRQLTQDIKLKLLGMESIVGTDQQDGQYSQDADNAVEGRTGKNKTLRIYRTMKKEHWDVYAASGDPKDILWGHGGSLGQALHYFLKSKDAGLDDVLVEFAFTGKAKDLVDHTSIKGGGEGDGVKGGKLTGKSEANDVMDLDSNIFSINLSKSKDFIANLNPKVTLMDKVL